MTTILTIFTLLNFIILVYLFINKISSPEKGLAKLLSDEFSKNRLDINQQISNNKQELLSSSARLTQSLELRQEIYERNFTEFENRITNQLKERFSHMVNSQNELIKTTDQKLDKIKNTVEEKLHKTLEERLGQSFKLVSERLEAVQKGLGEMKVLANGVGDLKKILSNVKTRGVLGEIQLANILEQILAPEQYSANVKTKSGSNAIVEFAIKLPGNSPEKPVYLPIDAKFPQEDYIRLQEAYEKGSAIEVEKCNKSMNRAIKGFAKTIRNKYIDPPNTTDFGIMFLPLEGLYAEVARQPELISHLQREYKIIITGPSTLAAMLNSLQMGFKTLAIQKRSSEVWEVLGAVKTEFGKFGGVLEKAQKKIMEANNELDSLVNTRTKMMFSKLKQVEKLPESDAVKVLDI
ncbi:MAG: DNA recombination protein RmuC [Flavobacteriaceae bacterium]|nr:DNA recombination protein RmuC [Flavobacteriaceae bacterium]